MACTLDHQCVSFISPTRRATIKRLTAYQPHGMLSHPRISWSCPRCVILRLQGCGWTEVSLSILCHRHTECCSVLTTDGSRSHRSVVMAHPLLRLSVAGRMGNVFDGRFIWLSMSKEGDCFSTTGICVSVATPGKTPLTY